LTCKASVALCIRKLTRATANAVIGGIIAIQYNSTNQAYNQLTLR